MEYPGYIIRKRRAGLRYSKEDKIEMELNLDPRNLIKVRAEGKPAETLAGVAALVIILIAGAIAYKLARG